MSDSLVTELLAPGPDEWEPVNGGESGASVFYAPRRRRYAKIVSAEQKPDLLAERDRCLWINETAIPSSGVLDWHESDAGACLITGAVPGVPAGRLEGSDLRLAWPEIVEAVRALHSLTTDSCPFDRGLDEMLRRARAIVAEDRVVVGFLPPRLRSVPPTLILEQIETELPLRVAQERAELVVGHGDLCLPNIMVDPATMRVTGLIDVGRLGTADPYGDIALLLATARETWTEHDDAAWADQTFAAVYGTELDPDRQDFYLRLDALTW